MSATVFRGALLASAAAAAAARQVQGSLSDAPTTVSVDWSSVVRPLRTVTAFQTVVNPLTTRDSPIHDAVYGSIAALKAPYQRYVPWLPYPKLGVAAMEPPSGSALCGFVNQAGTPTSLPLTLDCGAYGTIASVTFASYGRPHGWCGSLTPDATCAYPNSAAVVAAACVGKPSCSVPADGAAFGGYTCPGNGGVSLAAQVTCSGGGNFTSWDFSYVDPGMLDFFDAAKGRTMIPNFSTPPQWLYVTSDRVSYPDDPLGETWNYEQGTQLKSLDALGDYYGRLYAHYLEGGFTDEAGVFIPGYRLPISHIEVLNEIESEHHDDPATYTAVYDAIVAGIRRFSPTGSAPVKFVGLALEGEEDDYVSYFLNASNHNPPSTPVDIISFHHYASCSDRDGGVNNTSYEAFFPSGDDFVNAVTGIVAIRDALRPATLLDADEVGVILPDDNDGKWTSDAPGFAPIYWNAAASMYAYLFGRTAVVGLDILGESQLVGYPSVSFTRRSNGQPYTAPPQFPSVAMLNWTKGEPTARYWALKLLLEEFTAGAPAGTARVADTDLLVTTTATGPAPSATNPFCGSVENGDTLYLACADPGATINAIQFASYGTPTGACGSYAKGACDAANSTAIVTAACVGKNTCSVFAMTPVFGDPCYGTVKYLKVQATCTGSSGGYQPASASAPVYAQAFVEKAGLGARKVLLVNTRASAQAVTVPGATGGTWRYVDESTGFGPPASAPWAADTLTLAPFALGVLRLPAAA